MASTQLNAGLVTVDRTAVSPKVRNGSAAATVAAFVASYVLGELGRWSFFNSLGANVKDLVGAVLIALFSGVIAFTVGYLTSHGQTLVREVTTVLGADNVAVIRSDIKAALGELVAAQVASTGPTVQVDVNPPAMPAEVAAAYARRDATAAAAPVVVAPAPDAAVDTGEALDLEGVTAA